MYQNKAANLAISPVRLGKLYEVTITSQGPNSAASLGSNGSSILVPNAKLGDKVLVKIVKIHFKKSKFALGKIVDFLEKGPKKTPVAVGDCLEVNITPSARGNVGIANISNVNHSQNSSLATEQARSSPYYLIVKDIKNEKAGVGKVVVTGLKENYGFAKIIDEEGQSPFFKDHSLRKRTANLQRGSTTGKKFNIILPKTAISFGNNNLVALKMEGSVLFIKLGLGAKVGDNVRIRITKTGKQLSSSLNFKREEISDFKRFVAGRFNSYAFAKVIKIDPLPSAKKQENIKYNIEQMLKSGMHFGEKAVKCHAKMRDYIWIRQKGRHKNRPMIKKGRHFLNLLKTGRCLDQALNRVSKFAVKGRPFLFVGTKKPAASLISRAALFSCGGAAVNTRWLGGMLTNWKTILKSISKIRPILKEKQKIIQTILTKRQGIKNRLVKKILTLKKKSGLLIQKGRLLLSPLVEKVKYQRSAGDGRSLTPFSSSIFNSNAPQLRGFSAAPLLMKKRKEFIQKGQLLLLKRQQLLEKRKELFKQSQSLKEKGYQIVNKYQTLLTLLTIKRQKLRELRCLLATAEQIQNLKKAGETNAKGGAPSSPLTYTVSSKKLASTFIGKSESELRVIPNPPKEILNKIVGHLLYSPAGYNTGTTDKSAGIIIWSKLLSKLPSLLIGTIRTAVQEMDQMMTLLKTLKNIFKRIQEAGNLLLNVKKNLIIELRAIKKKLISEQRVITLLKQELKRVASEKRFLKFLPKLAAISSATVDPRDAKMTETVQILMKKFVDPKIKRSAADIYDQRSAQSKTKSKKIAAARKKKWQRLEKYFGGVANMLKINKNNISKNIAIIIGQQEEMNAVRECQKLGIQMFHVVDTNCNPTLANHYVPANDDSRNSIKYVLTKILTRIRLAQKLRVRLMVKSGAGS
jgi:small subunit ribosomal protein S2